MSLLVKITVCKCCKSVKPGGSVVIAFSSASREIRLVQVERLGKAISRLCEMLRYVSAGSERDVVVEAQAKEAMLFLLTSRVRKLGRTVTVEGNRLPVSAFLEA